MLVDPSTYEPHLKKLDTGLYEVVDRWSVHHDLFKEDGWYPFMWAWPEFQGEADARIKAMMARAKAGKFITEFGSCDSVKQFLRHKEYGKVIINDPEPFCVTFVYENQETSGGRRWHKNGPHIGRVKPQYEYFADETKIKEIYSFFIYRKKE